VLEDQRRQSGDIFRLYGKTFGPELFESRIHVERVPQDNNVHHEAQRAKLIFLSLPVALAQFAPLPMKDGPRQFVSVLATIQLGERPSAFGLVIDIRKAVNGFIDASEFGDCLSQLRWAVVNPKRSHDRGSLNHAELE
jgi:hypothetical protein